MHKKARILKKINKRDFYVYYLDKKFSDPDNQLLGWKDNLRIIHGLVDKKRWPHYEHDVLTNQEIDGYWLYKNNFIYFCITAMFPDQYENQNYEGVYYAVTKEMYLSYPRARHKFYVPTKKTPLDAKDLVVVLTKLEDWFALHPDLLLLGNAAFPDRYVTTEKIITEDILVS